MHPYPESPFCPFRLLLAAALATGIFFSWAGPAAADREAAQTAVKEGNDRFFERDFSAAEASYTEAVSQDPDWAVPYNNRGLARYKLERLGEAETDFGDAIQRDAAYLAPLINRSKCRAAQSRWSDALADVDAGLAISPDHSKLRYNQAWIYDAQGDANPAADAYEALLALEPEHVGAMIGLAIAYAKTDRTAEAVTAFYEALALAETGDVNRLLAAYDLQLLRGPGVSFVSQEAADAYELGVFHLSTGQHSACQEALNQALALERGSADAYWARHLSYLKNGQEDLAKVSLEQAGTRLERHYIADYAGGADVYLDGLHRGNAPVMLYLFPGPSDLSLRRLQDSTRLEWIGPLAAGTDAGLLARMQINPGAVGAYTPFGPVADADGDLLADAWETAWFGNLSPAPADDAPDTDSLSNQDEYRAGTNPADADTDSDGLADAAEVAGRETDPARANQFYYVNDGDTLGDVYCTAAGDNANDGLAPGTPKASLTALLAAVDLAPGAVVRMDTGIYISTGDIVVEAADGGSALLPVTLRGAPGGGTVLQRSGGAAGSCVVRLAAAAHVIVKDLVFTGAQYGWGLLDDKGTDCRVLGCVARDNAVGFRVNGLIQNSLAYDNDTGIDAGASARVLSCTVAENRVAGVFARGGRMENTIVTASGTNVYAVYHAEGDLRSDHNDLFATAGAKVGFSQGERATLAQWRAATGQDLCSIGTDPLFAGPQQNNFALRSAGGRWDTTAAAWVFDTNTSPAVDAGTRNADSSDEPAPNGGRINLGAFGNTATASKSAPQRRLALLSPTGGERYAGAVPIRFRADGTVWTASDTVSLEFATSDAPTTWMPVVSALPPSLSAYIWEPPDTPGRRGTVRFPAADL